MHGAVATLTFNRPGRRNAITSEMWRSLIEVAESIAHRADVAVLVVTGAGGVFSAGADLAEITTGTPSLDEAYRELAVRGIEALAGVAVPTVAAIDGACIGAGVSLALACDTRFGSHASFYEVPAVRHGIVYDRPSVRRLLQATGAGRGSEFLFSGERLTAAEALSIRLIDHVSDDAATDARAYAEVVASLPGPVLRRTKSLIRSVSVASEGGA